MEKIIIQQDLFGALWAIGWIFSIGYLSLSFWKGVLALFIWPYYLGVKFRGYPKKDADTNMTNS